MIAYRIFEARRGQPCTLFHGIDGTRTLPTDRWISAKQKPVTNPGKKSQGQVFTSGFHVWRTRQQVKGYLARFKHNRPLVICRIHVCEVRPKPGSKILLSDEMLIRSADWRRALQSHYAVRKDAVAA